MSVHNHWKPWGALALAVLGFSGCTPGEPRVNVTVRLGIPADFSMPVGQDVDVGGDYIVEYEAESSTAVLLGVRNGNAAALQLTEEPVVVTANSDAPERGRYGMKLRALAVGTAELELTPRAGGEALFVTVPESAPQPPYRVRVTVVR